MLRKSAFLLLFLLFLSSCNLLVSDPVIGTNENTKKTDTTQSNLSLSLNESGNATIPKIQTENENGTNIGEVTVKPACIKGENGGEIFFRTDKIPKEILFQIKEEDQEYQDILKKENIYEALLYFSICDSCNDADFALKPDKVYIFRIRFDYKEQGVITEYSNEHIIDTTNQSEFMQKTCTKEKIILQRW